jgi:hypothetical protein
MSRGEYVENEFVTRDDWFAAMTLGELYDAAERHGFEFAFRGGAVAVGSPLMGWDRNGADRTTFAISRAMRRRWREFVGFVELRLLARAG